MISIGRKGLKVIKPAAKAVQFCNEKSIWRMLIFILTKPIILY